MNQLDSLYSEIAEDPLYAEYRKPGINIVKGLGSVLPDVIFVGEAPGRIENVRQMPFVGPAGTNLRSILHTLNMTDLSIYYTNLLKYWPQIDLNNEALPDTVIEASANYVRREIELVAHSKTIIGLCGRTSLRALFPELNGVSKYNGASINDGNRVYVPLFHPAVISYRPHRTETVLKGYSLVKNLVQSYGRSREPI